MDIILYTLLVPWNYPFLSILLLLMGLLLQIKFMIKKRKEKEKTLERFSKSAITIVAVSVILGLYWLWRIELPHTIFHSDSISEIKYQYKKSDIYFEGKITKREDIEEFSSFLSKAYIKPGGVKPSGYYGTIEIFDSNRKLLNEFRFAHDYTLRYADTLRYTNPSIITAQDAYEPTKKGLYNWLLNHGASTQIKNEIK